MMRSGGRWVRVSLLIATAALAGCAEPEVTLVDPQMAFIDASAALRQASDDPDPVTRANAIEAIAQTTGATEGAIFEQGLDDPYPAVRFAAAMAIGETLYEPARDVLVRMARREREDRRAEPDKRVFCGVIYALHRLGDTSVTGELGPLLFDAEREVRCNAAMVMGGIAESSALPALRMRLGDEHDPTVQLQIVEAMAMLGDSASAALMESYTKTQFLEDRLVAISAMERVRSDRARVVLRSLLAEDQPPRVRVAAAGAMGRMGEASDQGRWICTRGAQAPKRVMRESRTVQGESSEMEMLSLQRLAAISLGWMKDQNAVGVLHPLLKSDDGPVRVAAAMSILRLLKARELAAESEIEIEPEPQTKASPQSQGEVERPEEPRLHTARAKE